MDKLTFYYPEHAGNGVYRVVKAERIGTLALSCSTELYGILDQQLAVNLSFKKNIDPCN